MSKKIVTVSYHEDRDTSKDAECVVLMFNHKRYGIHAEWLTKKQAQETAEALLKSLNPEEEEEEEEDESDIGTTDGD